MKSTIWSIYLTIKGGKTFRSTLRQKAEVSKSCLAGNLSGLKEAVKRRLQQAVVRAVWDHWRQSKPCSPQTGFEPGGWSLGTPDLAAAMTPAALLRAGRWDQCSPSEVILGGVWWLMRVLCHFKILWPTVMNMTDLELIWGEKFSSCCRIQRYLSIYSKTPEKSQYL